MANRVLVVDDDVNMQMILRRMLNKIDPNLNIDCVSTASAAYRILNSAASRSCPYDVVIADFYLPGSTGLALWDSAQKLHPYIDFCIVSGMTLDDWCQKVASESDCPPYFQKPISEDNFRQFWKDRFMTVGVFSG